MQSKISPNFFSPFQEVFSSSSVGMRYPELRFFRWVLNILSATSNEVIFVDSDLENIFTANSLGIRGVIYNSGDIMALSLSLRNLLENTIQRGMAYLIQNSGSHHCVTSTNVKIEDNFADILILEATGNWYCFKA